VEMIIMNVPLEVQIERHVIDEFKLKEQDVLFCAEYVSEEYRKRNFDVIVKTGAFLKYFTDENVKKWCYNQVKEKIHNLLPRSTVKGLIKRGVNYYFRVIKSDNINNNLIKKGVKYYKISSALLPKSRENSFVQWDGTIFIDLPSNEYKYE